MASHRFMIVTGEASGDLHGAHLVRSLVKYFPESIFYGVGGVHLQQAGVELLSNSDELGVVGISEVIKKLGTVIRVFRKLSRFLKQQRPDLLILVDYPEFNFLLARVAFKIGIPIVYYISPQVWAWRPGRVNLIRRLVTKMIVIFPFEQEFYKHHGVDVEFVGHPLIETVRSTLTREAFCRQHGLNPANQILGLLPGSRGSEVQRLLPVMLDAAQEIRRQRPEVQCVIPLASSLQNSPVFAQPLPPSIRLIRQQTYETINAADLIVTASGTVTVEAAILETPMIITYIVSPLTYWLGKRFIQVPFIGMVNLIAGKQVVPELIQQAVTPERIGGEVLTLLQQAEKLLVMKQELRLVHQQLGDPGAADRAAEAIAQVLKNCP